MDLRVKRECRATILVAGCVRVECDCRATILVAVYEAGRIPALQVAKKNQKIAFAALSIILKIP